MQMQFTPVKLQLHDAIYRLRFYSNSLIHILSLSNSHNNIASIQKNRGDKSHRVIVALRNYHNLASCTFQYQLIEKYSKNLEFLYFSLFKF